MPDNGCAMLNKLILIYCEGETERNYFEILQRIYRLPSNIIIASDPCEGRELSMIDEVVERSQEYCNDMGVVYDLTDVWAVCDDDNSSVGYIKLRNYAEANNIHLAYSSPQFENFLEQHFEQCKSNSKGNDVEKELSNMMKSHGINEDYCKPNLNWLENMLYNKPSLVKMVITNAEIRNNHAKQPFFTVHELVKEIIGNTLGK